MAGSRFTPAQSTSETMLLFTLTSLFVLLALVASALQWRGGAPLGELAEDHNARFPGDRPTAMFPHYIGWQYAVQNRHLSRIALASSTSAGLEQILPWLFYHRTIGVTHFFLFVEGKAASRNATFALEAVPRYCGEDGKPTVKCIQ